MIPDHRQKEREVRTMKRWAKAWLAVGVGCCVCGAALTGIGVASGGSKYVKSADLNKMDGAAKKSDNPDILDASKVNVLPKVEEPTVSKKEVEYATTFFPATSIPADLMRPYVGTEVQPGSKPGYIRAGYGNYGNLDLLANYLFRLSDRDKLNVRFQMDGMDGKLTMPEADTKWNAYYYRTRANIDYIHQFNKVDFNIAANFGLSNFNLSPVQPGKQKFTSGDFHLGVKSTDENYPIQFEAETNLMMYNRQNNNTFFFNAIIRNQHLFLILRRRATLK